MSALVLPGGLEDDLGYAIASCFLDNGEILVFQEKGIVDLIFTHCKVFRCYVKASCFLMSALCACFVE
jgi:hypothetical protein